MGRGKGMSRKNCSVSRPAVPLPTAMISLPNRLRHVQSGARRLGRLAFGAVREERVVVEELSLLVQADGLAPGAEPGVDRQHPFAAERRRQEQFAQIGCEDPNGLLVRPLLERHPHLGFQRPAEQTAIAVVNRRAHLGRVLPLPADENAFQQRERIGLCGQHRDVQDVLRLAAAHGEDAVGGGGCRRLLPFEIIAVLGPGNLRAGHHPAGDDGLAAEHARAARSAPPRLRSRFRR